MRKLWLRRRAVSTMIGGLIVLALLLTALVAALVLSQQYDAYQSRASNMEAKYVDRFAEKLVGTYPGVQNPAPGVVKGTNQYTILISNVAGIGSQIARIYLNASSNVRANPCSPTWVPDLAPCILNPSTSPSAVVPNTFNVSQSYINPGEFSHKVVIWLPTTMIMLGGVNGDPAGSYQFTIVTTRGGLFSFSYPFPPLNGVPGGGTGGTALYIGPLVVVFDPTLISFTNNTITVPPIPIPEGWQFPSGTPMIFYIKVYNQGVNKVYMTADSEFMAQPFGTPSKFARFYIVAPMDRTMCTNPPPTGLGGSITPQDWNTLDCRSSYIGGNTYPGAPPLGPGQVNLYNFNTNPYVIYPNATKPGICCGSPVYLLFSADWIGGKFVGNALALPSGGGWGGPIATYLNLGFEFDDGKGQGTYIWGVNVPFLSACEVNVFPLLSPCQ